MTGQQLSLTTPGTLFFGLSHRQLDVWSWHSTDHQAHWGVVRGQLGDL